MSKFNTTNTNKTLNCEGHVAYNLEDKTKLVTMVCTTFFNENKYYGDNSNELVKLASKLCDSDPKFVSNLAIYARKEMNLRSVSHVLSAIIAHELNSKPYIKQTMENVVVRADDLLEILACYLNMYGKPIPNGLKKALGNGLKQFDEFLIAKYNGGHKKVKFKDILKLTHVKADDDAQNELFKKILEDNLMVATRWETQLSEHGNTAFVWEQLIDNNQIGYMAALRNLRNMLQAKPANINKIYDMLSSKDAVMKSKQLPFRFYNAYMQVKPYGSSKVLSVIETAIKHSIANLPKIQGKTVIAIDVSGSMTYNPIAGGGTTYCSDIACLMAVMASSICEDAIVYTFDSKLNNVTFPANCNIIQTASDIKVHGGATYMHLPFEHILNNNIYADRIIVFSDNQVNYGKVTIQKYVKEYREKVNENLWVHAIDLAGYGTTQFTGKNTNIIAGWSERILEFIALSEAGFQSQVELIENYI